MEANVKRETSACVRPAAKGWVKRFVTPFLVAAMFACACVVAAPAYADEPVAWIGETGYSTLEAAVTAAKSGDTITLGEGKYTLYKKGAETKGKDLTFVGQGADKTAWGIGATVPDPDKFGTEYNGDYSFDGAGTITFQNMTLQSGTVNYLGFIRADRTVVDNCVVNGKTFYWGYTSATFTNTTFNAPAGDYALWTYSSPVMTFDTCTFNASGRVINVYTDYGAGKHDITVNFRDCTVNSSFSGKQALNINDSNMGGYKYILNIEGINTINGLKPDKATCSRLFGFGGKAATNNTGRTDVYIDNTLVWTKGKMVSHEIDTANDKYTDGYEENNYTTTVGEWDVQENGTAKRTITKTCNYCGWTEETEQTGYVVTYTDGVDNETLFEDQTFVVAEGETMPAFDGTPTRDGYTFIGWSPEVATTVTKPVTYTAQWKQNSVPEKPEKPADKPNTKPAKKPSGTLPKTGDELSSIAGLTVSACFIAAATAAALRRGTNRAR